MNANAPVQMTVTEFSNRFMGGDFDAKDRDLAKQGWKLITHQGQTNITYTIADIKTGEHLAYCFYRTY